MRLDKYHSIAIKVAVRDADGDYMFPLYDTVSDLLDAHPDATSFNPRNPNAPFPKANFVFQIIDSRTGTTPPNVAEAYENINDAYTAYQLHVRATPEDDAVKQLYREMQRRNVHLSHFQHENNHHVSIAFLHNNKLQAWSCQSADLPFIIQNACAYIDAARSGRPLTINL